MVELKLFGRCRNETKTWIIVYQVSQSFLESSEDLFRQLIDVVENQQNLFFLTIRAFIVI